MAIQQEQVELVREMLRELEVMDEWDAVIDDDVPPQLAAAQRELVEAYRRADVEWLLEHTAPDIEITQVPELPGARSYHGREGFVEALLDWPRQWLDFRIEPRRVFAVGDDHLVTVAVHRGRPRMVDIDLPVEVEIAWLMCWRDGVMSCWRMFLNADEAVAAALD